MTSAMNELADMHWKMDLLGSIEVGIVVLDKNFTVKVWNEFMHHHSGVLPSQVQERSLFEVFPDIDQSWLQQKTSPVFQLRSPVFLIWEQRPYLFKFEPNRPITAACDFMYQNVTVFPLASLTGEVEQICIMIYDVTDEAISKQRFEDANQKLHEMTRVDGLTGLFNRRYWEEKCHEEFKRCCRTQNYASLIMLDIDHFKAVNDNFGHPAGDKVIKALADLIVDKTRETDMSGRYGGEEFAIVLPETRALSAKILAERLRKAVEELKVSYEGKDIPFTISLGIAEFNVDMKDPTVWVDTADKCLYKAKESGRNRTVVHGRL